MNQEQGGKILHKSNNSENVWDEMSLIYDYDLLEPTGPIQRMDHSIFVTGEYKYLLDQKGSHDIEIGLNTKGTTYKEDISEIDLSKRMFDQCLNSYSTFHVLKGEFPNLDLYNSSYDLVVSNFDFNELDRERRKKACYELFRIVKPGGRALLLDLTFPNNIENQQSTLTSLESDSRDKPIPFIKDIDELLRDANFTNIKWIETGLNQWSCVADK